MPLCTGLPPGELMRSTTACAPASSKALAQRRRCSARRWPRCRPRSRRALPPARCAACRAGAAGAPRCASSTQATQQRQPSQARRKNRRASGARCAAGAAARAPRVRGRFRAPGKAPRQRRGRRAWRAGGWSRGLEHRVGRLAQRLRRLGMSGDSWRKGLLREAVADRKPAPAGCRGKDTNTPGRRVPRPPATAASLPRPQGPPTQRPSAGFVGRAVDASTGSSAGRWSRNSPGCQSISVGTCTQRFM